MCVCMCTMCVHIVSVCRSEICLLSVCMCEGVCVCVNHELERELSLLRV